MPAHKIYDSPHQAKAIYRWIKSGLILREGETYKGIYSFVRSVDNCQLCSVKFNDEILRYMDHSHATGFFRQVLCNKCNIGFDRDTLHRSKTGHRWITPQKNKQRNGKIKIYFVYDRKGFKRKSSVSLTKLICYSFINLLKEDI
tara:strand:+ start:227 stop:658 length:432 start_codon:yes stop_codon:yes gene_type:complete